MVKTSPTSGKRTLRMSGLGHVSIANPTGSTITWTAPPEFPEDVEGAIFSVYVIVTDEDGNQDWVFDEISVYADEISMVIEEPIVALPTAGGCGSSNATDTSACVVASLASSGWLATLQTPPATVAEPAQAMRPAATVSRPQLLQPYLHEASTDRGSFQPIQNR